MAAAAKQFAALREEMVERQIRQRGVDDPALLKAMRTVPRHLFVDETLRERAYTDGPLPIGAGQTISQPYIFALMIGAAKIGPCDRVLEVGAGSGYAAAILGQMAAQVIAIERHEELAVAARRRMANLGYDVVDIRHGDGASGAPDDAPFDAILVAARTAVVPVALKARLTIGGRLIIPVGNTEQQSLRKIVRHGDDEYEESVLGAVRFVPLILPDDVPANI